MQSASPTTEVESAPVAGTVRPPLDAERHRARERRRTWARNLRYGVLALAIAGGAVGALSALRPQPVPVDVASVSRGSLVVAIEENGITRVKDRFVVSAPVTGSLSRLRLEPGDAVKEGDALAEIAPALSPLLDERTRAELRARLGAALSALGQSEAQVARARAQKELAAQDLARARTLHASGAIPSQQVELAEFSARMRGEELSSAEFGRKIAIEEVRIARVGLEGDGARAAGDRHVDVVSPISGRVLRVLQRSAGVVQASTPLVEVGDPAALEVVVDLLTTDAVHVAPGTPVVIRGWGGEHSIEGKVRRVEPSAFTRPSALGVDEQRVNVIVALTDAPERWAALGDGYRIEARIVLWRGENVLRVPQGAVFRRGDGWAVFRIDGDEAKLTSVSVGHRGETDAEITAGLSEGASVLVHPGDRVKDGVRIVRR
ncbi:MAG TPA: HlyD family efflux transporter periplasmic adaptor subunit [Polyangiaceae bacterium]|nr:HlyD family efflux transporter periplasmic adaptor subunit [Polyangiaceae bacterium]